MAMIKQVESGMLLLLLGFACCIVAAGGSREHDSAGRSVEVSISSGPIQALATRIQVSLQRAWMEVTQRTRSKENAASEPVLVDRDGQAVWEMQPEAHPWPEEFTIEFTTKGNLVKGFLAYDWANKRQVIWHGPNSTYCEDYGVTDASCYILFNGTGIYVVLPSLKQCWLETPGVGTVPPDWTVHSVYQGVQFVDGVGPCLAFGFPPTDHAYWETFDSRPCVFVFPVPDMTYYFLPDTEVLGTPDESYFQLPSYCNSEKASSSSSSR